MEDDGTFNEVKELIASLNNSTESQMQVQIDELKLKILQLSENKKKTKDILELMLDNSDEIKEYFTISKQHVKSSFRLACCMCIFGILIFAVAIFLFFYFENQPEPSIIAAVCGGAVELFAGTALIVHRKSLSQLNHYYDKLHNNEIFLSTVNLVNKLSSTEKQDEVYIKTINNQLDIMKSKKDF